MLRGGPVGAVMAGRTGADPWRKGGVSNGGCACASQGTPAETGVGGGSSRGSRQPFTLQWTRMSYTHKAAVRSTAGRLPRTTAEENDTDRIKHNDQIKKDGAILDVIEVVLQLLQGI